MQDDHTPSCSLTPEQRRVLREEGTEAPFTSALLKEKGEGDYACAGCGATLFPSSVKFDSGTGWPSFYDAYPGALETKTDHHIGYARTEYHCAKWRAPGPCVPGRAKPYRPALLQQRPGPDLQAKGLMHAHHTSHKT